MQPGQAFDTSPIAVPRPPPNAAPCCRLPQPRCSTSPQYGAAAAATLQEMRAFWLPGKTPEAKALLEKPSMDTLCPASGAKLKLKARFTLHASLPWHSVLVLLRPGG